MAQNSWPNGTAEIQVTSSKDGTSQPAFFLKAEAKEARPLLVGLHTWSGDYKQTTNGTVYARWALQNGWHFIYPNFRGPNHTPAALGSDLAVSDVVDAVNYAKTQATVDTQRIYLIGVSGGGHMALLLAGRHPEIWAGVSAWCGISDIAAWHSEHLKAGQPDKYARDIEAAVGGSPQESEARLNEARKRSPLTWLKAAGAVPLDINHGIHDGRTGSVPFRHSLYAYNEVVPATARLEESAIRRYYDEQKLPVGWAMPAGDALYSSHPVLFRNQQGNARVTLFEGGHEILYTPALNWLAQQRQGQPAVWKVENPVEVQVKETQSGL